MNMTMINDLSIENKYNIFYKNGSRVYKLDLCKKTYNMDSYRPNSFIIDGKEIVEGTWTRVLVRLTNYLINKFPLDKDEMINCEIEWSKSPIFMSEGTLSSHVKLDNNLYINCNRTSTHLCWTLQEILKLFDIDCRTCELYINIPHNLENPEVVDYLSGKYRDEFRVYLEFEKKFNDKKIETVFSSIDKMDIILRKHMPAYLSFLLIDSSLVYANVKSKYKKIIFSIIKSNDHVRSMNIILVIISDFLKYKNDLSKNDQIFESISNRN